VKNVNNGGVGHKCSTENPVGQTFIAHIVVTCIWDHIRRKNWMKVKIGSYPDRWVSVGAKGGSAEAGQLADKWLKKNSDKLKRKM